MTRPMEVADETTRCGSGSRRSRRDRIRFGAGRSAGEIPNRYRHHAVQRHGDGRRQPITLPSGPLRLVVSQYVIPPGSVLPVHRHPYARYAYVQAGRLKITNVQSGVAKIFGPGDVVVEMINIWHSATPVGTETVRLLVFDQLPPGGVATVLRH